MPRESDRGERWTQEAILLKLKQWKQMGLKVIGVDEAGRGPLAGPVVAAAVFLPYELLFAEPPIFRDSKKLKAEEREKLFRLMLQSGAKIGIGKATNVEIDRLNIRQASALAMRRAIENLKHRFPYLQVDLALVDGDNLGELGVSCHFILDGDEVCPIISAASIIAKVVRDNLMSAYGKRYPQYGFAKHKGYPTREHIEALRKFGPCPIHRLTFSPLREFCKLLTSDQRTKSI
ncbi:MAG: ribonuclease HII [Armatimonadota bacterium]|nr:ribonuclease HII [Armatimonadota bacterium]